MDGFSHEYNLISGFISLSDSNKVIVISIVYKDPPKIIQIKARSTIKLEFLTSIQYSEPVSSERYHIERDVTKRKAIDVSIASKHYRKCLFFTCHLCN